LLIRAQSKRLPLFRQHLITSIESKDYQLSLHNILVKQYVIQMNDSLTKKWKTTTRPDGPTGYKRKGTFRDISLSYYLPEYVDDFDSICISKGVKRSELMKIMDDNNIVKPLDAKSFLDSKDLEQSPGAKKWIETFCSIDPK